jgi:hypothetical protein
MPQTTAQSVLMSLPRQMKKPCKVNKILTPK